MGISKHEKMDIDSVESALKDKMKRRKKRDKNCNYFGYPWK